MERTLVPYSCLIGHLCGKARYAVTASARSICEAAAMHEPQINRRVNCRSDSSVIDFFGPSRFAHGFLKPILS